MNLWPKTILGQFLILLFIIVLLLQLSTLIGLSLQHRNVMRNTSNALFAERVSTTYLLLIEAPADQRSNLLKAVNTRFSTFVIADMPIVERTNSNALVAKITRAFDKGNSESPDVFAEVDESADEQRRERRDRRREFWRVSLFGEQLRTRVSMLLPTGEWMNVTLRSRASSLWALPVAAALIVAMALALLTGYLMARRITGPLERLRVATHRLGLSQDVGELEKEGPEDIQDVFESFNGMQARLRRFVDDQAKMLAAISHDLRSPITSIRIRSEFIDGAELKEKMYESLDQMKAMVEATLLFAKDNASKEVTQKIDLAILLSSLADDMVDLDMNVTYKEPESEVYRFRHLSMLRAIRNIVENAVRYGGKVEIRLERNGEALTILVLDDGPGICADQMQEVFKPFVRIEKSRNQMTGGIGLGLSIARSTIRSHGGDIVLESRPEGGLAAKIELPVQESPVN